MGLGLLPNTAQPKSDSVIEPAGTMIGRYKLLEKIGEGGFGVVFMAEQVEPVQRKVALKIIKAGMDTREVIARFEAERQAIALMDHPNIARALDAGATEAGRPYFVMELVRGIPITEYCDQNKLPTRERLQLFTKVCQAVQHAHQKGVIHRDIKPSNVLVTLNDGEPVPKVIDFGVAKALGQKLTGKTLFTAFNHMIGTPAYMSPEQAALSGLDIDTRADIYSLGVLLYELLTGVTPFDTDTFRAAAMDEVRRMIQETEPPKPSTRLQTLGDRLTQVAKHRHTEPAALSRLIRGDLDWIVMRCLEKDRQRRYETANGLATDVVRHLANEPVTARAPSTMYRFQKMVQRNKLLFAAGSAVTAALLIGSGVSTWLFLKEKEARQSASQARQVAEHAREQTTEKLYESYLAQARANRLSGQPGRYFGTLETIAKAVAIRPSLELRNETVACLALNDLRMNPLGNKLTSKSEEIIFSRTLEFFAQRTAQETIMVRRVRDNQELGTIPVGEWGLHWLHVLSADGRYLAFSTHHAAICVWDFRERAMVFRNLSLPGGLAPNPAGDSFASMNADGSVSVYEFKTQQIIRHPTGAAPGGLAKSLDAKEARLACYNPGTMTVEIVDLKPGVVTASLKSSFACDAMDLSADGKWLAGASSSGNLACLWDATTGELLHTFVGHDDRVTKLAFNHAGTLLATTSWDDTIRLWDVFSGAQVVAFPGSSYQMQFSLDDQQLGCVVQGTKFGLLDVANHPEYRRLALYPRSGYATMTAVSPDNRWIAAVVEGEVRFWDFATGQGIGVLPNLSCGSVHFDSAGTNLITSGPAGLERWPIQSRDGTATDRIRIGPRQPVLQTGSVPLFYSSLSVDGGKIATTLLSANEAWVIDPVNPAAMVKLRGHPGMRYISISPNGKWVATGTWNGSKVRIWDSQSGKIVQELPEPGQADVLFSPDGHWLVTGGTDYHLWETETWRAGPPISLSSITLGVGCMAFSRDSQLLAVTCGRRGVRLLEAKTGRTLADLESPTPALIKALCFSHEGNRLVAADGLGQVHVWNLPLIRQRLAALKLDWDLPVYPHGKQKEEAQSR
jgi:serine/threonine protein kinase/WD40 repeat protein